MKKLGINVLVKRIGYVLSVATLMLAYYPNIAAASQITARTLTIGSSVASANTTYSFGFTAPSATVVKSAEFVACTTAGGTCTTPAGFSVATSNLAAQPVNLGDAAGWIVNTATPGSLRLSKAANVAAPTGSQTVSFSSVTNPSATNATFFVRMTTYSTSTWTSPIDTGTVAASTAGQVTVTASVDETLTFTLATASVALGTLSTGATGTGTSSMTVSTNAATGYSLSYTGTTLTSGANTITALAAPTASSTNSKQFGLNLMSNTTPAIGTATTGAGTGVPSVGYNTTNQFKFNSGDTIASAIVPTNSNTYTASYIANIDGLTAAGPYSTVLTYSAMANF